MEIASKYDPSQVEDKWYQYWLANGFFKSVPDDREPYTIVIPPPNVTGVLHMGHMLNNTIQDILVRRARMMGKNACWVPGTDHASIATEAKVVAKLADEGIWKTDLTREEFLKHAWDWTHKHGGIILEQLKKLGASCDWDRTCFTMDEKRSRSVISVFTDLYNKGKIYRGVRMVNWDPKALTALSDEEVIYREQQGKLYYVRYEICPLNSPEGGASKASPSGRLEGPELRELAGFVIVATTRPETIMGDTALCINPNNPKTRHLRGRKVIVPLVNRVIPVIEDEYVDMEFGTGCLKVTPAHDVNDYILGEKYHLPVIDIFNNDGTISEAGEIYIGMDRFDVRKQIVEDLAAAGLLEKEEDYTNKVGFSERTHVPIEPKLSMQWFLRMEELAKPAIDAVMDDTIQFYPAKFKNTYRHWMGNIKDWCISRQLWWGHRIPAYYIQAASASPSNSPEEGASKASPSGRLEGLMPRNECFVAESEEEARKLVLAKYPSLGGDEGRFELRQDEDCLDTWFSSWLWPISVFDGINRPDNEDVNYYYPTNDLVTAPEIIFFWVARMIMSGFEYRRQPCFSNVYFTGIVRDRQGRKMSKSLGNSPDPVELMEQYGADGVRMGMLLSSPAGNDLPFDESLCEQGRNFNNKIWNAFRLVKGWEVADIAQPGAAAIAIRWFDAQLSQSIESINDSFSKYRISEALMDVYKLFRDDFSSWYLELVKPGYKQPIDRQTYQATIGFFDALLRLLHPFMPFITEELWHALVLRKEGASIMQAAMPQASDVSGKAGAVAYIAAFEVCREIIGALRTVRLQNNIPHKEPLELQVLGAHDAHFDDAILKMGNVSEIRHVSEKSAGAVSYLIRTTEYAIPPGDNDPINAAEEIEKVEAEIRYLEGFLQSVMKKLTNEKFVANAKPEIVANERKKQADAESKIRMLKASSLHLPKGD